MKRLTVFLVAVAAFAVAACQPTVSREVLLIGDSVTFQSAQKIVEVFNNVSDGGERYAPNFGSVVVGQGLSHAVGVPANDIDAWWAEHIRSLVTHTHPEVIVIELGYNDCAAINKTGPRIDNVMAQIPGDVMTYWVSMADHDRSTTCDTSYNSALVAARSRWPNLATLSFGGHFNSQDGLFADSVHFNAHGQAEYAEWLKAQLDAVLGVG